MCNLSDLIEERATERGMKKGIEKGIEKGKCQTILELIQAGVLTAEEGARWLNKTEEEMEASNRRFEEIILKHRND